MAVVGDVDDDAVDEGTEGVTETEGCDEGKEVAVEATACMAFLPNSRRLFCSSALLGLAEPPPKTVGRADTASC